MPKKKIENQEITFDELYLRERFQNLSFFNLSAEALNNFLRFCHVREFSAKSSIILPGDLANTLYYIVEGSVSVSYENEDGKELILAYLNKGDFIGEMGLFMRTERREVVVKTRAKTRLAEIGYMRLGMLLESELKEEGLHILYAIGVQLTDRLLQTSRQVHRLTFLDVATRVERALYDLCREPDALSHELGTQIKVSRQELSRLVGCSREMAGRVLKGLEEEGKVMINGQGQTMVVLHDRNNQSPDPNAEHGEEEPTEEE